MANYSTLKAAVADVVKTNGSQAITGANLQTVLLSIINSIGGGGYIFAGVATPSTSVGTPDQNVFYITGAGTFANMGTSTTVPVGSIGVFKYNGSWSSSVVSIIQLSTQFGGDGTKALSDALVADDLPTAGSDNLARSGGIEAMISEKVTSDSVNLFNTELSIKNKSLSPSGTLQDSSTMDVSDYIPVNGKNITLRTFINLYNALCVYDKDKKFIRGITKSSWTYLYTYEYEAGDAYIRANIRHDQDPMANYGNAILHYQDYNPIDGYMNKKEYRIATYCDYYNKYIKELYISELDSSKFYYIYSLQNDSNYGYQFYIGQSDTESIPASPSSPTIIAHYDSVTKPDGLIKLTSTNHVAYAVIDWDGIQNETENQSRGRNHLLNFTVINNSQYSPTINAIIEGERTRDYSVTLYEDESIVVNNHIAQSAYTTDYAVYKISGNALVAKRDFVISGYKMDALTCQYVTAWDKDDNFLGSFGTVNNNDLPLKPNVEHEMLIKTSDYIGIDYLLLVIQKSVGMPKIKALPYDNLSYLPENKVNSVVTLGTVASKYNFTKFVDAVEFARNNKNTTILVAPGTYDICTELGSTYFDELTNTYYQGPKIGSGTVIKATGYGVKVKAQYTGDNDYVGYQFSILNVIGSCTVEGIDFIGENIRYIIHDDAPLDMVQGDDYIVKFVNCRFNHKGSTMYDSQQSRPIAFGAGTRKKSIHILEGCRFVSESPQATDTDVAFHNQSDSQAEVVITNCYFIDGKAFNVRAMVTNSGTIDFFVSNNSFGRQPTYSETQLFNIVDFNNTIR